MALDRQKILNELGSVVNQLQSADCGCMGKLFSDSNRRQGGAGMNPQASCGMCQHAHCPNYGSFNPGHGHGSACRTPCTPNMCLGQCNPPKLYADTYSYLNKNLMQPVVNEVYNDLKTITPENTIMNNPMGTKMGMPLSTGMQQNIMGDMNNQPQNSMQSGDMGFQPITRMPQNLIQGSGMGNQLMPMTGQQMGNQNVGHALGGIGPQIIKMMTSPAKGANQHGGQSPGSIVPSVALANASGGMNPGQNDNMNAGMYQGQQLNNNTAMNQGQYNPNVPMSQGQYNATEGVSRPHYAVNAVTNQQLNANAGMNNQQMNNLHANNSNLGNAFSPVPQQSMNGKMLQGQGDNSLSNPVYRQMASPNRNYGQHTQGMTKFNEMFPGVTNGDLGFDPMSIALQMNPANHQKVAMEQMQKIMNGSNVRSRHMDTAIAGVNAAMANMAQGQLSPPNQQQNTSQVNQQELVSTPTNQNQQLNMNTAIDSNQQQVYAANTGAPTYQGQPQQIPPEQQLPTQMQQHIDPATGAIMPPAYEGASGDNPVQEKYTKPDTYIPESDYGKMVIKDPIFPVNASKYQSHDINTKRPRFYDYNTLGQPIEKFPAKLFRPPSQKHLPQTLSPQPVTKFRNDYNIRFGVKQTESKTSLVGIKPVGRNPSRSQMQHIYNKYKGSHSDTQQRLKSPSTMTSERQLQVAQRNVHQVPQAPIEKVGGDTIANNNPVDEIAEKGYPQGRIEKVGGDNSANNYYNVTSANAIPEQGYRKVEQMGDAPADKHRGDVISPTPVKKSRNGLQDQVHIPYGGSSAWSFHGGRSVPFHAAYSYRNRRF